MISIEAAGLDAADVAVVGMGQGRAPDPGAAAALDAVPGLDEVLDRAEFEGKSGQLVELTPTPDSGWQQVIVVGIGDEPGHEDVRRAAGAAARKVTKATSVGTTLHARAGAACVVEGFILGQYRFDKYRSEPKPAATERLMLADGTDDDLAAAAAGTAVAKAVSLARDLVNEPPVSKSPRTLAEIAVQELEGVAVTVHDEGAIEEMGLGGLMGVNAGAHEPARLVEMRYEGDGATKTLAFVGKGIVFDSGGLSLKPANMMEDMKTDMSGGAAVIGAMKAIAELGLSVNVIAYVPLTENLPGGNAMRPGDVLRARNGKTIEVLNTDAEGRLVLADGLSLAAEAGPDMIIDIATLTGAIKVALGEEIAGYWANDDDVAAAISEAGTAGGERLWPMPLPADYRKKIDSDIADMKNTGPRWGGAINAAHLLQEFVGDVPWGHIDIAGPARAEGNDAYITKGGTGFGVRTLVALADGASG